MLDRWTETHKSVVRNKVPRSDENIQDKAIRFENFQCFFQD